ncbi:biotin-dependent carboxyltransferase family protein [Haliscomenobacter hydrossis]|uniref:Urea amidolyase related protein n=1 Tax=Haliscomenobacter hydrossis (strain ATCC 27775 / DSM 1100 / LMG 10767 / O) TaxID=760192 RepID=F4KT37_HALH1|nr:biotin-dependent carboxyltransferase family protein [Haliscomenobacter hydrossis]AEE50107.1 urea amidolyase related protein [Haliscomenobacter hydrossis DSM 1100]
MSILVLNKGLQTTVQDLGRSGYAHFGINRSGAMDPLALQVGNFLVGNPGGTAALEMCFPAPALLFLEPALIALSGADFGAQIEGQNLPLLTPIWVDAGMELHFRHKQEGQYAYLSICGGLDILPWLNSSSTNLKAQWGGWQGRALLKGDRLPLAKSWPERIGRGLKIAKYHTLLSSFYDQKTPIRFVPGQHYPQLLPESRQRLHTQAWLISNASDRMGYRLAGAGLKLSSNESLLSAGLTRGSIQLPPAGQPIVLMADHQTTGGYPLLGQVIQADWARLAQLGPGRSFYLQAVDLKEAVRLYAEQGRFLRRLKVGCLFTTDAH